MEFLRKIRKAGLMSREQAMECLKQCDLYPPGTK